MRDLDRSEAWYTAALGFERIFDHRDDERGLHGRVLRDPQTRVVLAMMQHDDLIHGPFEPRRRGLDHLSFAVADRAELRAWERHLADLAADYTPFEEVGHGAAVTARDPDGIALEFYVRGGP